MEGFSSTVHEQGLLCFNFARVDHLNFLVVHVVVAQWLHVLVELKAEGCRVGNPETQNLLVIDACEHFNEAATHVLVRGE